MEILLFIWFGSHTKKTYPFFNVGKIWLHLIFCFTVRVYTKSEGSAEPIQSRLKKTKQTRYFSKMYWRSINGARKVCGSYKQPCASNFIHFVLDYYLFFRFWSGRLTVICWSRRFILSLSIFRHSADAPSRWVGLWRWSRGTQSDIPTLSLKFFVLSCVDGRGSGNIRNMGIF